MVNKPIYFDIDEKIKKKFQLKLMLNGISMVEYLTRCVREYVYGKQKANKLIARRVNSVKNTRRP